MKVPWDEGAHCFFVQEAIIIVIRVGRLITMMAKEAPSTILQAASEYVQMQCRDGTNLVDGDVAFLVKGLWSVMD